MNTKVVYYDRNVESKDKAIEIKAIGKKVTSRDNDYEVWGVLIAGQLMFYKIVKVDNIDYVIMELGPLGKDRKELLMALEQIKRLLMS